MMNNKSFKLWSVGYSKFMIVSILLECILTIVIVSLITWDKNIGDKSQFFIHTSFIIAGFIGFATFFDMLSFGMKTTDALIFKNLIKNQWKMLITRYLVFAIFSLFCACLFVLLVFFNSYAKMNIATIFKILCAFMLLPFLHLWIAALLIKASYMKHFYKKIIKGYLFLFVISLPIIYYPYFLINNYAIRLTLSFILPWINIPLFILENNIIFKDINILPIIFYLVLGGFLLWWINK